MIFEIKQALAEDLDDVNELNKEVQALHYKIDKELFKSPENSNIREELQPLIDRENSAVLIARANETIMGFISYRECSLPASGITNEIPMIFIHHMGVKKILQKQGIGNALLNAVFKCADEKGIKRVQLDVWTLNVDAKAFFQKRGFSTINEVMIRNR